MNPDIERLVSRAIEIYPKGLRGALNADEVAAYRGLVDHMIDVSQEWAPDTNWCPLAKFLEPDRPKLADDMLSRFVPTRAFAFLRETLGDRIVILLQHTIVRRRDASRTGDRSPWHLDVDFMGYDGEMLNMWIPLVDVGAGHPGLTFIIGEEATRRAWAHWSAWAESNWSPASRVAAKDLFGDDTRLAEILGTDLTDVARTPILKAGDAILFNQAVLHRTQDPTAAIGPRYSVELRLATLSDLPQTYRAAALPSALVSVEGGRVAMKYMPSDRLPAG